MTASPSPRYRRPSRRNATQRGFTLIEFLLVLALLVIIAAIAWPSFTGMLESQRLKSGGDMICANWGKARVKAMRTGQVYVFEFQLSGNQFRILPIDEEFSAFSNPTLPGGVTSPMAVSAMETEYERLPDQVTFRDHTNESDTREMSLSDSSANLAAGSVRRIYFYPDGTTSTTRVRIANEKGRYLEIDLRGLTGVAEVSDIFS